MEAFFRIFFIEDSYQDYGQRKNKDAEIQCQTESQNRLVTFQRMYEGHQKKSKIENAQQIRIDENAGGINPGAVLDEFLFFLFIGEFQRKGIFQ